MRLELACGAFEVAVEQRGEDRLVVVGDLAHARQAHRAVRVPIEGAGDVDLLAQLVGEVDDAPVAGHLEHRHVDLDRELLDLLVGRLLDAAALGTHALE